MTTLTANARPGRHDGLRPLPWRRMAWVTWRQHRAALAGVAALLGAAAIYLLIASLQMHHAYAPVAACRPAGSSICQSAAGNFLNSYAPGAGIVLGLLQVVPPLIAAFVAAPCWPGSWRPVPSATRGRKASAAPGGQSPS